MPTHVVNICAEFHCKACTKYGDITSCELGVNRHQRDRQTARWGTQKHNVLLFQLWVYLFIQKNILNFMILHVYLLVTVKLRLNTL